MTDNTGQNESACERRPLTVIAAGAARQHKACLPPDEDDMDPAAYARERIQHWRCLLLEAALYS